MADDTVKITIRAVDEASKNLKSVYGSLRDLEHGVDEFISAIKDATPANKAFADRLKEITRAYENFEINGDEATAQLKELKAEMHATADAADQVGQAGAKASDEFRILGLSVTDISSAFNLAERALGYLEKAYDATVGVTLEYAMTVQDTARAMGGSAEEASKFIQIADDVRVETDTIKIAFRQLNDNGIQPNIENLKRLSDEYLALPGPVERAQFAAERFGMRAGTEMQRVLELGSDAIDKAAKSAEEAGLVMGGEAADAAEDYRVALDNLNDSVLGIKIRFGNELIPMLTEFADAVNNIIGKLQSGGKAFEAFEDVIARFTGYATIFNLLTEGAIGFGEAVGWLTQLNNPLKDTSDLMLLLSEREKQFADETTIATLATQDETSAAYESARAKTAQRYATDEQVVGLDAYKDAVLLGIKAEKQARDSAKLSGDAYTQLSRDLAKANDAWEKAAKEWSKTVGGDVVGALKDAKLKATDYYTALGLVDQVMGTNFQRQEDYRKAIEDLVKSYDPKNPEAFKEGLEKLRTGFEDLSEPLQAALEQIDDLTWKLNNLKNMTFTTTLEIDAYINGEGGRPTPPNPRPPKPSSDYPEPYDLAPELPNASAAYNTTYSPVLLQTRPNETITQTQAAPAPSPVTLGPNYFTNDIEIEVLARQVAQYMTRNR